MLFQNLNTKLEAVHECYYLFYLKDNNYIMIYTLSFLKKGRGFIIIILNPSHMLLLTLKTILI